MIVSRFGAFLPDFRIKRELRTDSPVAKALASILLFNSYAPSSLVILCLRVGIVFRYLCPFDLLMSFCPPSCWRQRTSTIHKVLMEGPGFSFYPFCLYFSLFTDAEPTFFFCLAFPVFPSFFFPRYFRT